MLGVRRLARDADWNVSNGFSDDRYRVTRCRWASDWAWQHAGSSKFTGSSELNHMALQHWLVNNRQLFLWHNADLHWQWLVVGSDCAGRRSDAEHVAY